MEAHSLNPNQSARAAMDGTATPDTSGESLAANLSMESIRRNEADMAAATPGRMTIDPADFARMQDAERAWEIYRDKVGGGEWELEYDEGQDWGWCVYEFHYQPRFRKQLTRGHDFDNPAAAILAADAATRETGTDA